MTGSGLEPWQSELDSSSSEAVTPYRRADPVDYRVDEPMRREVVYIERPGHARPAVNVTFERQTTGGLIGVALIRALASIPAAVAFGLAAVVRTVLAWARRAIPGDGDRVGVLAAGGGSSSRLAWHRRPVGTVASQPGSLWAIGVGSGPGRCCRSPEYGPMSRQDQDNNRGGSPLLLILLAGIAVWFLAGIDGGWDQPPAPEITVNVEAPAIEGDTINVTPPSVEVAPADVTVNVAPTDTPGEPPRPLTLIERAQALVWDCLPSMAFGPGICVWQLITAATS